MSFTKLSNLVDDTFTVESVGKPNFKMWDNTNKKMLVAEAHLDGYRKLYPVTTDKGTLDLGPGQLGNLLEAVFDNGKSDLIGRTFKVASNGKTGIDIRYYFNPVNKEVESQDNHLDDIMAEAY